MMEMVEYFRPRHIHDRQIGRQGAANVCSLFQKRLARAWLFLA